MDIFIEEIEPDAALWSSMQHKLKSLYFEHFGKKMMERLLLE